MVTISILLVCVVMEGANNCTTFSYVFSKARNAALRSKELYSANGGYFVSSLTCGEGKGVIPNEPKIAENSRCI